MSAIDSISSVSLPSPVSYPASTASADTAPAPANTDQNSGTSTAIYNSVASANASTLIGANVDITV